VDEDEWDNDKREEYNMDKDEIDIDKMEDVKLEGG